MESDRCRKIPESKVLVLNATLLPINICSWKRALILVFKGKAESIENSKKYVNSGKYVLPLVIKLREYIPLPYNGVVFTRKNIFLRDNYTCQYCKKGNNLTIDHVVPTSRGGEDAWENVVTCCVRCNNRKGDKLPDEANMKLTGIPYKPPSSLYLQVTRQTSVPSGWFSYFFRKSASN
jgi:5-methylcytosine-specific restriction endonuclease McrA